MRRGFLGPRPSGCDSLSMQILRPDPMALSAAQRLAATDPTLLAAPSKIFSDTDVRPRPAAGPYYPAERGTPRETSPAGE
jgi:hypothetical protein